jgi:hypothetical protein
MIRQHKKINASILSSFAAVLESASAAEGSPPAAATPGAVAAPIPAVVARAAEAAIVAANVNRCKLFEIKNQ